MGDHTAITKSVCLITNCDINEGSARTKRISAVSAAQAYLPGLGEREPAMSRTTKVVDSAAKPHAPDTARAVPRVRAACRDMKESLCASESSRPWQDPSS
jgi:hypothetical protein